MTGGYKGAAGHMGPTLQPHIFVGQGPCALPWVRYGIGGRTEASAPTEAQQKVQWAGDRKGRPYLGLQGVRGRNPPVTAAPCQPPLGKGAGDRGTDCHSQCAHWLRNDMWFCKGCGTGIQKQVSRFTHLFLSCSFLRQFRIIGQERFVSRFCDLIRRGFEAILDVLQEIATKSECKISAKRRSFNCAVLP